MAGRFSRPLFRSFVEAFLKESARLANAENATANQLTRKSLAAAVYREQSTATSQLARLLTGSDGREVLFATVDRVIEHCERLLQEQYVANGFSRGIEVKLSTFTQRTAAALGLPASSRITASSFVAQIDLEAANSPSDVGLPDTLKWADTDFGFADRLDAVRDHAVEVLNAIRLHIAHETSERRRIALAQIAISCGALHEPGLPTHRAVHALTTSVLERGGIFSLVFGRHDDAIVKDAAQAVMKLAWFPAVPIRSSPTNCIAVALSGKRIDSNVARQAMLSVETAIGFAKRGLEIAPSDRFANLELSSLQSFMARMMLASQGSSSIRQADKFHRASLERKRADYEPQDYMYQLLRAYVRGNLRELMRIAEHYTGLLIAESKTDAAAAVAAFASQSARSIDGSIIADRTFVTLTRKAMNSPAVLYGYSHMFDAMSRPRHRRES